MNSFADLPLFHDAVDGLDPDFLRFHDENPAVYALLVRLAYEAKDAGMRTLGIKALYERARWDFNLDTTSTSPKLNNNYTSQYARLIMAREPRLDGLFNLRERRAA
jgi:hypothetical protein